MSSIASILIACVVLIVFFWQNSMIVKSFKFEQLSRAYPPSSIEGRRYHAIAQALRDGKTNYDFTVGQVPPLMAK